MSQAIQQPGYDQPGQFPQPQTGTRAGPKKAQAKKKAKGGRIAARGPTQVGTPPVTAARIAQRTATHPLMSKALEKMLDDDAAWNPHTTQMLLQSIGEECQRRGKFGGGFAIGYTPPAAQAAAR